MRRRSYAVGYSPTALVAEDFNRDGRVDLAVLTTFSTPGSIRILLNEGGGFRKGETYAVEAPWAIDGLATGFFIRDGIADIVFGDHTGAPGFPPTSLPTRIGLLPGKGDGSFHDPVYSSLGALSGVPLAYAVADLDGDGRPDLIAYTRSTGFPIVFCVLRNTGGGSFEVMRENTIWAQSFAHNFAVADFSQDGRNHIVSAFAYGSWGGHPGTGLGILASVGADGFTYQGPSTLVPIEPFATTGFPHSVAVADFDGDGYPDVAVLCDDAVAVFMSVGAPYRPYVHNVFRPFRRGVGIAPIHTGEGFSARLAAADIDGDGAIDLVFSTWSEEPGLQLLRGRGDGSFDHPAMAIGPGRGPFAFADFDGDGQLDVATVAPNTGEAITVYTPRL